MTETNSDTKTVFLTAFSTGVAQRMGGDYLDQISNEDIIFNAIEISIQSGDLFVCSMGIGGMVERPYRKGERTFPVGDYRVKLATVEDWLKINSPPTIQVATVRATQVAAASKATPNWKMQIQAEATAHCLRLRKAGASPTTNSIVDSMAKWCVDNNVRTDGGIFPRASYLRTHVLGGKHWNVPN